MAIIFDGKAFAAKIEEQIKAKIAEGGKKYKLATVYDASNKASRIYTNIKAKKAEELGIEFASYQFSVDSYQLIQKLNNDESVGGIMVQLPLPGSEQLIDLIGPDKDVDGLKEDSPYMPATVRAIFAILGESLEFTILNFQFSMNDLMEKLSKYSISIIGAKGEIGKRLEKELTVNSNQLSVCGVDKEDFDREKIKQADIVISATGQAGLVKPEMVKEGAICIDVGYPLGDFDPAVAEKAAFFTPVPGGVGPVTVAMLFANLVQI